MGFGSGFGVNFTASTRFSGGGTDRLNGPYANYDAALTALRADAGASDGDVYKLASGDVFVAQSIGSSFGLIPSRWADAISGDVSNANGSALRIAGEAKATTLARGWVENNSNGTITASGDALRFDSSTTASGRAQLQFTPTAGPATSTGVLVALVIQMIDASTTDSSAYVEIRDGTKKRRLVFDNLGVTGDVSWHYSNGGTPQGDSDLSISTNKSVLFIYCPASGEYGSVQAVGDPTTLCAVDYAALGTTANTPVLIQAFNNGGGATKQTIFDLFDIAIWETT